MLTRLVPTGRTPRSALAVDIAETLPDRVVPASGLRVRRRTRPAYGPGGGPVVWSARSSDHLAFGQGASGLTWDAVSGTG
ncbi:hypothetical protein ACWKSP_28745 [Micromonosporaceae bacterium Da 78-11]